MSLPHNLTQDQQLIELFHYIPNKDVCLAAIVLFVVMAIVITVQLIRTRSWLMLILTVTALAEAVGFIGRLLCISTVNLNNFILTTILLIVCPNFIALVNYMVIGTLAQREFSGTKRPIKCINRKTVAIFFCGADIASFVIQAAAAYMLSTISTHPSIANLALGLLKAGFGIQLGCFGVFAGLVTYVYLSPAYTYRHDSHARQCFIVLYLTIALLVVRASYRMDEFIDNTGVAATTEVYFYVLDALMVLLCFVVYAILPIGAYMPAKDPAKGVV